MIVEDLVDGQEKAAHRRCYTEKLFCKIPYSVQIRGNKDLKKLRI